MVYRGILSLMGFTLLTGLRASGNLGIWAEPNVFLKRRALTSEVRR